MAEERGAVDLWSVSVLADGRRSAKESDSYQQGLLGPKGVSFMKTQGSWHFAVLEIYKSQIVLVWLYKKSVEEGRSSEPERNRDLGSLYTFFLQGHVPKSRSESSRLILSERTAAGLIRKTCPRRWRPRYTAHDLQGMFIGHTG